VKRVTLFAIESKGRATLPAAELCRSAEKWLTCYLKIVSCTYDTKGSNETENERKFFNG
jgi:hypothetical protein